MANTSEITSGMRTCSTLRHAANSPSYPVSDVNSDPLRYVDPRLPTTQRTCWRGITFRVQISHESYAFRLALPSHHPNIPAEALQLDGRIPQDPPSSEATAASGASRRTKRLGNFLDSKSASNISKSYNYSAGRHRRASPHATIRAPVPIIAGGN